MDECVAVAVAEAVAVAVTEAVAEADQSTHDLYIHESINPSTITVDQVSFLSSQCARGHLGVMSGSRQGHFFDFFLTFSGLSQECSQDVQATSKGLPTRF